MDTASFSVAGRRRRRKTHSPMSTTRNATPPTVAPEATPAMLEWCASLLGVVAEDELGVDELEEKYCVAMARSKSNHSSGLPLFTRVTVWVPLLRPDV